MITLNDKVRDGTRHLTTEKVHNSCRSCEKVKILQKKNFMCYQLSVSDEDYRSCTTFGGT